MRKKALFGCWKRMNGEELGLPKALDGSITKFTVQSTY